MISPAAISTGFVPEEAPMEARWYCLRTKPKHEHIAAAHVRLCEGVEVYCPRVRIQRHKRASGCCVPDANRPVRTACGRQVAVG